MEKEMQPREPRAQKQNLSVGIVLLASMKKHIDAYASPNKVETAICASQERKVWRQVKEYSSRPHIISTRYTYNHCCCFRPRYTTTYHLRKFPFASIFFLKMYRREKRKRQRPICKSPPSNRFHVTESLHTHGHTGPITPPEIIAGLILWSDGCRENRTAAKLFKVLWEIKTIP